MDRGVIGGIFIGIAITAIAFIVLVIVRDLGRQDILQEMNHYGCNKVVERYTK